MIISNSLKFIFVHVNKTAGTSITDALYPHLQWNDIVLGSTPIGIALNAPYKERFSLYKHSTAQDIRAVVGEETWREYRTFAVIRDPVDRAFSLYTYIKRHQVGRSRIRSVLRGVYGRKQPDWIAAEVFRETDNFSEFIRHPRIRYDPGFKSQHDFVSNLHGEIIVDRILRFDRIESEFMLFCGEMGLDIGFIGHKNRSWEAARAPAVSGDDAEFLNEHFYDDFLLYQELRARSERIRAI